MLKLIYPKIVVYINTFINGRKISAMPEVTVNKNNDSAAGNYNIWLTKK